jgi:hypothetical protein
MKGTAVIVPFLIFLWLLSLHQGVTIYLLEAIPQSLILPQQIASFLAMMNNHHR